MPDTDLILQMEKRKFDRTGVAGGGGNTRVHLMTPECEHSPVEIWTEHADCLSSVCERGEAFIAEDSRESSRRTAWVLRTALSSDTDLPT